MSVDCEKIRTQGRVWETWVSHRFCGGVSDE
jgi:hypothetical protein